MIDHGIKSRALKNTPCTASGTFFKRNYDKFTAGENSLRFINRSVSK